MQNINIQHQNDIEVLELSINQWLDNQGIEWADPEEKMESYYQKKKQDIFSVKVDLENSDILENQLTLDNIEQIDSEWEINQYQYELSDQVQFAKSERCVGIKNFNNKNYYDLAMKSNMDDSVVEVRKSGLENNDNRELSDFNDFSENFNGLSLNESCVKKTNSFSLNKSQMNNSCGLNNINTNLNSNNSQNSQNNLKGIFNSPLMQRRMSMGQNKVIQMPRLSFSSLCGQKFSKFERQSQINKKNTNNYDNDKNNNNKNYSEVLENKFDKKAQQQNTIENY